MILLKGRRRCRRALACCGSVTWPHQTWLRRRSNDAGAACSKDSVAGCLDAESAIDVAVPAHRRCESPAFLTSRMSKRRVYRGRTASPAAQAPLFRCISSARRPPILAATAAVKALSIMPTPVKKADRTMICAACSTSVADVGIVVVAMTICSV